MSFKVTREAPSDIAGVLGVVTIAGLAAPTTVRSAGVFASLAAMLLESPVKLAFHW